MNGEKAKAPKLPNAELRTAAVEVFKNLNGQLEKINNVQNVPSLLNHWARLVKENEMSHQELDALVMERTSVISAFINRGTMEGLDDLAASFKSWAKIDHPDGNLPTKTVTEASNLTRVGETDDLYSAAARDLAAIAAARHTED